MASGSAVLADRYTNVGRIVLKVFRAAFVIAMTGLCSRGLANGSDAPEAPPPPSVEMPAVSDDPRELLKVDDDMRSYFVQRVKARSTDSRRLREIVDAILQPDGLNFAYDAEATFSARDTFRLRRGNCVAFSFLVAAVARDLGFKASFQNIDTLPVWNRFGGIVASIQHVNVRVVATDGSFIVDLRPDAIPHVDSDAIHLVRDEREFAQFYNNIGFFHLVRSRFDEALRYTTLATKIDPTYAGSWANLGGLYAQAGNLSSARDSYEKSLGLDRYGLVAIVGLVHVLRQLDSPEDRQRAEKLDRRARAIEAHNPFYQQYCGQRARERGDLIEAEKLFKLAIALKDDEPEFYDEWIAVLKQMGREADAKRAEGKLEKLKNALTKQSAHIVR
jgi:Flp pilus assembly protein TadD